MHYIVEVEEELRCAGDTGECGFIIYDNRGWVVSIGWDVVRSLCDL